MKKMEMISLFVVTAAAAGLAAVPQKKYNEMDANSDGKVSAAEYLQSRLDAFARLDTNGDGSLSGDEFKFPAAITRSDKDGDGKLNREEFNAQNQLSIKQLDKDGDGFLTLEELNK